jgi:hypothetical protein
MSSDQHDIWTAVQFSEMSWHDNHVHGFSIRGGEHGSGELILDLDYIVEWICGVGERAQFRVAPATLAFQQVTDLRIDLDYASVTAALGPFSIGEIRREPIQYPTGWTTYRWTIDVNWPRGAITFQAPGFTQVLRGPAMVTSEQWLDPAERT